MLSELPSFIMCLYSEFNLDALTEKEMVVIDILQGALKFVETQMVSKTVL